MSSDMSQTSVADRLARTATQIEAESAAATQELEQLVRSHCPLLLTHVCAYTRHTAPNAPYSRR